MCVLKRKRERGERVTVCTCVRERGRKKDLNVRFIQPVFVPQEINARSEVLRMERELQMARGRLEKLHQRRYQTDSETEQSG
jgi:hypothetical protein